MIPIRIVAVFCFLVNSCVASHNMEYALEASPLPYFMRFPGQLKQNCFIPCSTIGSLVSSASVRVESASSSSEAASSSAAAASSSAQVLASAYSSSSSAYAQLQSTGSVVNGACAIATASTVTVSLSTCS